MSNSLDLMKKRLHYQGGLKTQDRMINDKYRAFLSALDSSYHRADIVLLKDQKTYPVLIVEDKTTTNYDDKIISIDNNSHVKAGDIFRWPDKENSHWIIFLQELSEHAFFRASIRRCRYEIFWIDGHQKISSYAYVRGPYETKINFTSKKGLIIDNPNYSLEIYLPLTEQTKKHFKRYQTFVLEGTTWEVEAVDSISTEGILQVIAQEYYTNETLDSPVKEKVTDAFYFAPIIEQKEPSQIQGPLVIRPIISNRYTLSKEIDATSGYWTVNSSFVKIIPVQDSQNKQVDVVWTKGTSGTFTLSFVQGDQTIEVKIIAESLV